MIMNHTISSEHPVLNYILHRKEEQQTVPIINLKVLKIIIASSPLINTNLFILLNNNFL